MSTCPNRAVEFGVTGVSGCLVRRDLVRERREKHDSFCERVMMPERDRIVMTDDLCRNAVLQARASRTIGWNIG